MKPTIKDIVKNDLCTGCGVCTSKIKNSKMVWNKDGFLVPEYEGIHNTDDALKLCPFNPIPEEIVRDEDNIAKIFLADSTKFNNKLGKYINTYIGYSKEFRITSSSGGLATYVFKSLLSKRVVTNLFVVKEVNGTYEYQLFKNTEDIISQSKTRYIPVSMDGLFDIINSVDGTVGIAGVACFIKALRLKQFYEPELKAKIPFLIGIICGGLKSKFYTDFLAQSAGIKGLYHNQEYRLKDANSISSNYSFGAFDSANNFHKMRMKKVGDMWGSGLFKNHACDFCDDVTTELADISLGDAWIEPYYHEGLGNSIIITRSPLADQIIKDGIFQDNLNVKEANENEIIFSQRGSYNHRNYGLKYRVEKLQKKGLLIPFKRTRLFQDIPFYFKWVQNQRMKVRKLSLEFWKDSKNLTEFNQRIRKDREKLTKLTKYYHKFNKIKTLLFGK